MLISLSCPTQKYKWGKVGEDSLVGQLYSHQTKEKLKKENYAELWMGTHTNGPAKILETNILLSSYLNDMDENILGIESYKNELPFLLKVLSVNQALSIQAHPNKTLAKKLHSNFPSIYKDPNHKPELACALTDFEAFCGFQTFESISKNLEVPEFRSLIGEKSAKKFQSNPSKETLKEIFSNCMLAKEEEVKNQLSILIKRVSDSKDKLDLLLLRLNQQYPGDVGCFAIYFLNYVILKPGEALFLDSNEPHAYLSGDCMECMACSDNVVRAGLTPKLRDCEVLLEMLTYDDKSLSNMFMKPKSLSNNISVYSPPVEEFMLIKIELKKNESSTIEFQSASIFIVVKGNGNVDATFKNEIFKTDSVEVGNIYFNRSNSKITFNADEDDLIIFSATFNNSISLPV
eukprot:gene4343-7699_t